MGGVGVTLLGVALFSLLVVANLARTRSLIDPAVAMATVWTVTFVFVALSSGRLYGVSIFALSIFLVGVGAFSIGTIIGSALPAPNGFKSASQNDRGFYVLLLILIILVVASLLYLGYLRHFSHAPLLSPRFFWEVRHSKLVEARMVDRTPIVNNLVAFSTIAAVFCYAVSGSGFRWRILVGAMVGTALFYNVLTAAKVGPLRLVVMLCVVYALRSGRFPLRGLFMASVSLLLLFGVITVMRFEAVGAVGGKQGEAIEIALEQFVKYLVAGPVAFSVYLDDPQAVRPVWDPWYSLKHIANYFGDFFDIPSRHADYVAIGPGVDTNVYTALFSYYPAYGIGGVVVFMLGVGVFAGMAYARAKRGSVVWQLLYGMIFWGICMSVFNESFLHALNPVLKVLAVGWLLTLLRGRVRFGGREVRRGLLAGSKVHASAKR